MVTQKRIVDHTGVGSLPGNIEWAHHGAVTGRDDSRDVRAVIVVGRSLPPPCDNTTVERLYGAPNTN